MFNFHKKLDQKKHDGCTYLVLKSSAASLELSIWSRMLALSMVAAAIFREG